MHLSQFDYELPAELIAQEPVAQRDASRMLVLDRRRESWVDADFREISRYLKPNDLLVLNNTRVFPARLIGQREPTGGRVEVLLVQELGPLLWEALVRPGHRLTEGQRMRFGDGRLSAEVIAVLDRGLRVLRFECDQPLDSILDRIGEIPLPPYIKRPDGSTAEDRERYQTVYASSRGAVAAPTAGLHFTETVLEGLRNEGIGTVEITLHVGYGTFEPVRVEEITQHKVAPEPFEISFATASAINEARAKDGRIIAVGTTTTRALESAVNSDGKIQGGNGHASVTITPGYRFQVTDALLTNFHLPQSSLLLLVAGFAGREFVLQAYRHAVGNRYRFYSYGDCMLIL